jgi:ArsR family transcriptional regulator, lead/cadmium/zinc/bismuth-responsive transcriptional repressor
VGMVSAAQHRRKLMKSEGQNMTSEEMAQIRQNLQGTTDIEEAAELMNLAGNSTRLKLLYLLENMKELCVCDLAELLGVSVSAVSQHLSKLKAYGLVKPRRDAQTIYYSLTEHVFNEKLRDNFFTQFQV